MTARPPLSRRTFLRRSAVAGAVVAAPAIVGLNSRVLAQASREGKLGVALCGLGGFASDSIAPELPHAKNVYLAGVITGDPAGKGRAWAARHGFPESNVFGYDQFDRLAGARDIAIVHVVTPNALHAPHAIAAARAGKHVMVEKPMATRSADCAAMIAAAASARVRLGVSYRLNWEPHHAKAAQLLSSGAIGKLANGTYEFSWNYASALADPERRRGIKQWLLDPTLTGGGVLFDTGVYPVQSACSHAGASPVTARGLPSTRHPDLFPKGVEETMVFELAFPDGFHALGRVSYSGNFHQCSVYGPGGTAELLGGPGGSVYGQSYRAQPSAKRLRVNGKDVPGDDTLQLAVLLDAFADAIRTGAPFLADGAMGLRDIRILEAIRASASSGGVSVPVQA
jgi:glucose-fructose oxidoreductase